MAIRFDRGELQKPVKQSNGWLRVDGYLTRTGIFEYLQPDGTKRREYRPPEEVFKEDSLETFAMVPVTDTHPPVMLDAGNTTQFARGAVSDTVKRDGDKVRASLLITDAALVAKLEAKDATQVSCGYICDVEDTPGEFQGQKYDSIQRNIRGNHVAIVPHGRAGAEVRVRMDGSATMDPGACEKCGGMADKCDAATKCCDACTHPAAKADGADRVYRVKNSGANDLDTTNEAHGAQGQVPMSKIRIDGVDYDPSTEAFAQALAKRDEKIAADMAALKSSLTEATAKADKAEGRADAAAEALKKAEADLKELPAKVRSDMAARAELDARARVILGKDAKLDSVSPLEVRKMVLAKLSPELKLDGRSEAYVEARFDAALEAAEKDDSEWQKDADKLDAGTKPADVKLDADEAKKAFIKASQDAWKKPLTSAKSV
jgi:hypothetical protein